MSKRIFIRNLPVAFDDGLLSTALTDVLSAFGTVRKLTHVFEGTSVRPKNLWFAEMSTELEAVLVIDHLDGVRVGGRAVKVGEAGPRGVSSERFRSHQPRARGPSGPSSLAGKTS